jgi:transcriptional regulator with AAA-type ATPase domain
MTNDEIYTLTDGFTEQALQNQTLKNILDLTDAEKARIAHARPVSLHELKNKVQHLLTTKSKKNLVEDQTPFDPAYQLADPLLAQAARLGKHSLKDPKMMALLWNKFKSQTKIAAFLGVNRSSVNRRCKDYHLTS